MKPQRGEVWLVRFDPAEGSEMRKVRPAVVLNPPHIGRLPLCIVAPITGWHPDYAELPWFVLLHPSAAKGLTKESGADAFQTKSVSLQRLEKRMGILTPEETNAVASAVALCVGL